MTETPSIGNGVQRSENTRKKLTLELQISWNPSLVNWTT
jgi:hypothetical protein